jgi:hypothetical protein
MHRPVTVSLKRMQQDSKIIKFHQRQHDVCIYTKSDKECISQILTPEFKDQLLNKLKRSVNMQLGKSKSIVRDTHLCVSFLFYFQSAEVHG